MKGFAEFSIPVELCILNDKFSQTSFKNSEQPVISTLPSLLTSSIDILDVSIVEALTFSDDLGCC